jgi:hypothetical protein
MLFAGRVGFSRTEQNAETEEGNVNSLTLKSAVLLAGAAIFCFGFSATARAESSVTFTGGYTTTFSNSGGHFGTGFYSDDYRNEITTNDTWNGNDHQDVKGSFSGRSYLSSLTNLWILTPGPHPGFGWKPQKRFIRGLNVPEGGAPLLYLLLAGLSCFGTLFLSRRKAIAEQ